MKRTVNTTVPHPAALVMQSLCRSNNAISAGLLRGLPPTALHWWLHTGPEELSAVVQILLTQRESDSMLRSQQKAEDQGESLVRIVKSGLMTHSHVLYEASSLGISGGGGPWACFSRKTTIYIYCIYTALQKLGNTLAKCGFGRYQHKSLSFFSANTVH